MPGSLRGGSSGGGGGGLPIELVWSAGGFVGAAADWTALTSVTIGGVTWDGDNNGIWQTFGPDGAGNLEVLMSNASNYGGGSWDAPQIHTLMSNLTTGLSNDRIYIIRLILAAASPDPAASNEGIGIGFRTNRAVVREDCFALYFRLGAAPVMWFQIGAATGAASPTLIGRKVIGVKAYQAGSYFVFADVLKTADPLNQSNQVGGLDTSANPVKVTSPPTLDFEDPAIEANISGWGAAAGGGVTFLIEDIELWQTTN